MSDLTGQIGLRRFSTGFIGKCIEWATDSNTHHVVVAISANLCVSAEPGGVRYRTIDHYPHVDWSGFDHSRDQKQAIINAAHAMIGRPYNFAVYPPLLFQKLTRIKVNGWVARWLARRPHVNCSQMAGDVYTAAGIHLFPAISQLITPGDFERLFQANKWL